DPGYTAEKQSQSPAPAAPQRLTALQALQALVQQGNGQQAQRPDIEGSEGQGSEGTGNQGQQVAAPAGGAASRAVHVPAAWVPRVKLSSSSVAVPVIGQAMPQGWIRLTRSRWMRRLSAFRMRTRKPSSSTISLRLGR